MNRKTRQHRSRQGWLAALLLWVGTSLAAGSALAESAAGSWTGTSRPPDQGAPSPMRAAVHQVYVVHDS